MMIPLGWAVHDNPHSAEVLAFAVTISLGFLVAFIFRCLFPIKREQFRKLNAKDGLAIVGLSWIILSVVGALPLYLSHVVPTYTDALFEIVSGFTTTGATIFPDVESLPRGILFWRSLTQWLGGMGIIVLYIALLPALGLNVAQLYKAEAPGITVEKIEPRIKQTAMKLWAIYFGFSFLLIALYLAGGMSIFDAMCHSFSTVATGGFSTKNASIGAFSPYIQWVTIIFMFLAGVNFILHYYALHGRINIYWLVEECRGFVWIIMGLFPLFVLVLYKSGLSESPVRDSLFQILAIVTTTGYATADFDQWPHMLAFLLVALMFIGGCGGSTAGGMKIIRFMLALKVGARSVSQAVFPNAVIPIKLDGKPLAETLVLSVLAYLLIYIFLFFGGTMLLTVTEGCDLITAFTASISALSNVGPGLGKVGPTQTYAWVSLSGKWILSFLMLAGRLELYSILILLYPATWRK